MKKEDLLKEIERMKEHLLTKEKVNKIWGKGFYDGLRKGADRKYLLGLLDGLTNAYGSDNIDVTIKDIKEQISNL